MHTLVCVSRINMKECVPVFVCVCERERASWQCECRTSPGEVCQGWAGSVCVASVCVCVCARMCVEGPGSLLWFHVPHLAELLLQLQKSSTHTHTHTHTQTPPHCNCVCVDKQSTYSTAYARLHTSGSNLWFWHRESFFLFLSLPPPFPLHFLLLGKSKACLVSKGSDPQSRITYVILVITSSLIFLFFLHEQLAANVWDETTEALMAFNN